MIWYAVFGLISLVFILAGSLLAARRIRRHRQESETRRLRAFAQMVEIGEKAKERKKNAEHRTQNAEESP